MTTMHILSVLPYAAVVGLLLVTVYLWRRVTNLEEISTYQLDFVRRQIRINQEQQQINKRKTT